MNTEKKIVSRTDLAAIMKENYGISLKEAKASIEMVIDTIYNSLNIFEKKM